MLIKDYNNYISLRGGIRSDLWDNRIVLTYSVVLVTIYEICIWCFVNDLFVACVDGMYGQNCAQNCSNNCYNNTCHVVSGLCVYGCRKGWMGPYCQERKFTGFIIEKDFHSVNSLSSMCPYCKQFKLDGSIP
jgi:hypothetical protein